MAHNVRPFDVNYLINPTQDHLRELAIAHTPCTMMTAHGNLMKVSRNKARMAKYTYVIDDEANAGQYSHQVILPAKAQVLIDIQRQYIEASGRLIDIRGSLGVGDRAVPVQWLYTLEGANIAGMQSHMTFLDVSGEFNPEFQVIYTPNLFLEDMPGRQAILVDLKNYKTYIIGPDYFGESKKAALRMLNDYAYQRGGLVLHAGAKLIELAGVRMSMTIMGLSGTGKTTTTFSRQGDLTQPIQDDMVTIWPDGEMSVTESGCFAKTAGLTRDSEPIIYDGTLNSLAWVENTFVDEVGRYDFNKKAMSQFDADRFRSILEATGFDTDKIQQYLDGAVTYNDTLDADGIIKDGWEFVEWTQNGRSVIPMSVIDNVADLHDIPPVTSMGILNRDEGQDAATPGIVRFTSSDQAAAYFMLGETTKTSAAGKEVGKTRSPFTQPFFPRSFGLQAARFSELVASMPDTVLWMMNTGYVGIDLKVKIHHSSAMLEAMLAGTIAWKTDPDFDYDIVDVDNPANSVLLELVPAEILNPAIVIDNEIYRDWVIRMKKDRRQFLYSHGVDPKIIATI
jgi:phosphoenolpyruvate carboxykinase (ATP)